MPDITVNLEGREVNPDDPEEIIDALDWTLHERHGITTGRFLHARARELPCPLCDAQPLQLCLWPRGLWFLLGWYRMKRHRKPHDERLALAMLRYGGPTNDWPMDDI